MTTLIGLHGKMGSGKDTVFERMEALGLSVSRLAFADALKISAMASLGFRRDAFGQKRGDGELVALANSLKDGGSILVELPDGTRREITGREYLQFSGTEGAREVFGDNFWVDLAIDAASESVQTYTAVTDVRFPNEAQAILDRGGRIWRIKGVDGDTGDHPSETPLPDELISLEIDNTVRDDDFAHLDAQILKAAAGEDST